MKRIFIIFALIFTACTTKAPIEKAQETVIDYLKAHERKQLANAAEHSFHRINKTQFQFTAGYEEGSHMPFYGQGTYIVILDSTLSKVISFELEMTD